MLLSVKSVHASFQFCLLAKSIDGLARRSLSPRRSTSTRAEQGSVGFRSWAEARHWDSDRPHPCMHLVLDVQIRSTNGDGQHPYLRDHGSIPDWTGPRVGPRLSPTECASESGYAKINRLTLQTLMSLWRSCLTGTWIDQFIRITN